MKKIKWENIASLLYIIFSIYQLYYHYNLNGLYIEMIMEIIINIMFVCMIHYIIKDIRKNPKNWSI